MDMMVKQRKYSGVYFFYEETFKMDVYFQNFSKAI